MFNPNSDEPIDVATLPTAVSIDPDASSSKKKDELEHRHRTLVQCLRDERDLQYEERIQMAIDHDYHDHLHWRQEDAAVLIERGQAPLVYNEGRQTIEWVCGVQKRMRMDEDVLPREKNDEQSAEAKSKVFKYVSDVNLAPWHESQAYKQAVIGGLGWLEEGINTDPGAPLVYSGSESWRNVIRDSRDLGFDQKASRYLFRLKKTDLDYAIQLLPKAKTHLIQYAGSHDSQSLRDDSAIWYLGERLTGASDLTNGYMPNQFGDRSAYIGGSERIDHGRRLAVDLIEAYYRVPEAVQLFGAGPLRGKEFNKADDAHQQLARDRWSLYRAVTMRMRVMIMTESAPVWDGKSPFRHQEFGLIPVWGYRRGRDGQCYGLWRGMRDINDDINKRASKAQFAASSNRMTYEEGTFEDEEEARAEAARPDMALKVKNGKLASVRFEKPTADMQMNMELIAYDRDLLKATGGVNNAAQGNDSGAISGKAIGLQQDQSNLTTSELPDNLRLAKQMAGKRRLSHIEQFMTEQQVIRITGEGKPMEWVTVNEPQEDGSTLNDIASKEADYVIGERDYRETYAQAAMEQMMELLGQVAGYAPEVVMNVLDLIVESTEIKGKDEWVARIRKLNGQRDPKKPPTPDEQAAAQKDKADGDRAKAIQLETLQAGLDKLHAEVAGLDATGILKRVEVMMTALQAAQIVAMTPNVAPVADTIAEGAGLTDQDGSMPDIAAPPVQPQPAAMPPEQAAAGADPMMATQAPPDTPMGMDGMQQQGPAVDPAAAPAM